MLNRIPRIQFEHLDEEVEHLAPENLHVFTVKELNAIWDKLAHHAHTRGDPWLELPFILRSVASQSPSHQRLLANSRLLMKTPHAGREGSLS